MQKRIRTLLILLPFLAVMCRCAAGGSIAPGEAAYPGIDGMRCSDLLEYFGVEGDNNLKAREVLACTLTCPGTGKVVKLDFYAPEGGKGSPRITQTNKEIQQKYCDAASPTATGQSPTLEVFPTATATETATPLPTETLITVYPPILSGLVTQCDLSARYINFRILPDADPASVQKASLQLGGVPVTCGVSPGNATILTCSLPEGFQYPASVLVTVDGIDVNRFEFDGAACVVITPTIRAPLPSATPAPSEPTSEPTATPDCSGPTPGPGC